MSEHSDCLSDYVSNISCQGGQDLQIKLAQGCYSRLLQSIWFPKLPNYDSIAVFLNGVVSTKLMTANCKLRKKKKTKLTHFSLADAVIGDWKTYRPVTRQRLPHTEILVWLRLRQDQVDDGDQCREEAQDQGEVVEGAHQEDRVAQWVDHVDQRLGAQVSASKWTLQGLSWHSSCHGSQCTQCSRGSSFQATVLLGLNEGRRHHLPAQHQSRGTQAQAQDSVTSWANRYPSIVGILGFIIRPWA